MRIVITGSMAVVGLKFECLTAKVHREGTTAEVQAGLAPHALAAEMCRLTPPRELVSPFTPQRYQV